MVDNKLKLEKYLKPTLFMDFESPKIQKFINSCISDDCTVNENIIRLYYKVRDTIRYDTYDVISEPLSFKASRTIKRGNGFCIPKAILLAAVARAIGVPSRLGFADVTNHIASENTRKRMGTNEFVFHSYTDLFLNGKWVKATPAFNKTLCDILEVEPLDFNGKDDSLFQQFDKKGNNYMEYIRDRGTFDDLPYNEMMMAFKEYYPHLFEQYMETWNGRLQIICK